MPRKSAIEMSPEWMARFQREMTDELYKELTEYVDNQARRHQSFERREDRMEGRALVHDAISDTIDGIRFWDPDGPIPLAMHIRRCVQSRMSHMVTRAKARRCRAIDDLDEFGDNSAEIEVSLRATDQRKQPVASIGKWEVLGQVRAEVAELARDDDVLVLLDELIGGRKTGEICRLHGWTEQEHENVVRRLRTIALGLPVSLRRALLGLAVEAVGPAAPVVLRASDADDDDPVGEDEDGLSAEEWTLADTASESAATSVDAA
jgi:hypothetical protein